MNMPISIGTEKQRAEKKKVLRKKARKLTPWQKERLAEEKLRAAVVTRELVNVDDIFTFPSSFYSVQ
jgi:hypothetical protein